MLCNGDRVVRNERVHPGKWSWKSNSLDVFRSMSRLARGRLQVASSRRAGRMSLCARSTHSRRGWKDVDSRGAALQEEE